MGNFAENLNLGNRFRPPLKPCKAESLISLWNVLEVPKFTQKAVKHYIYL